jgi:hypothetical protein
VAGKRLLFKVREKKSILHNYVDIYDLQLELYLDVDLSPEGGGHMFL